MTLADLSAELKANTLTTSAQIFRSNMKAFSAIPPNGTFETTTPTSTMRRRADNQARPISRLLKKSFCEAVGV
jgi:hypothetical protein